MSVSTKGKIPDKLLLENDASLSENKPEKLDGMDPVNWLFYKLNSSSRLNPPRLTGMGPVN